MFNKLGGHIPLIEALRGIASVAVCLFHFTKGYVPDDSWARTIGSFGWMGVEMFFVISGFVIPYSLLRASFALKDYGKFLKKRIYRIEPAYLLSIVLVLVLNWVVTWVPGYQGLPFNITYSDVIYHVGYLVNFFDGTWFNPVYWSLEIEFHYYIIIGFLVAAWGTKSQTVMWISLFFFTVLSVLPYPVIALMKFTDIFTLGILAALFYLGKIDRKRFLPALFLCAGLVYYNHGMVLTMLCVGTALAIGFFHAVNLGRTLNFLGKISFSLYLLHVPIGGRVINLAKRLDLSYALQVLVVLLALLISIGFSWIFYRWVERPSFQWSKSISYKNKS